MNPHVEFVGVDLSEKMLELAEKNCRDLSLKNISFVKDDITKLSQIRDKSFDGVFSSVALHHLPSEVDLSMTFKNISRVLTDHRAIYITDFLLLKNKASIDYLLSLNKDQPKIFKDDYYASLSAAFTKSDFQKSAVPVSAAAKMYSSFGAQFLMILKSRSHSLSPEAKEYLRGELQKLSQSHRSIYSNLSILFSLSGMV
jgi:ubiquinone/menaquinone biosynthesis C-methylase UbiE